MKMKNEDCRFQNAKLPAHSRRWLIPHILLITIAVTIPAFNGFTDEVYSKNKKGNELYKKGSYEDALKQYDDALLLAPADTLLKMNKGSTLYRLGKFDDAEAEYNAALSQKNKKKQADAHYNLGNIQFKQGDALSQSGGQGAMDKYKSALQHYITALDLQPYNKDAKWNIELAQRRIKLQEQQNQQNTDNKDNKDNKDKQKQDQQNKDKKNQDKKDQEKKDQDKKDQEKNKQDQKQQDQQQQNQDQKDQKQQPQPQPQQSKEDMKKQEAKRLIEQFADDADSLNKPPEKKGLLLKMKKPEKDW
jgi:Ca-activated chloride channel family protein